MVEEKKINVEKEIKKDVDVKAGGEKIEAKTENKEEGKKTETKAEKNEGKKTEVSIYQKSELGRRSRLSISAP